MAATHRPKKSLGQHFLKDPAYLRKIADAAQIGPRDRVLEIGPGLGHLTRTLASRAERVLALELDDMLIPVLRKEFADAPNVEIVHADALTFDYESLESGWKVVANLPYYISTPIIQRLLACHTTFTLFTLMLQKEVAERIAAPPGGREYGYISVLVQFHLKPMVVFTVPPGAFSPPPKVDSAVITLKALDTPNRVLSEDVLIRLIKAAFSQRRKTLRNSLKQLSIPQEKMASILISTGIDPGRRAETLSVEEFCRLADYLLS